MRLVGDILRRVIRGSLDADTERPELRQFRGDPVRTVLADRGRYIAVLTIVRGYLAADCPGLLPPLASFADWSRLVRSSLVWLGYTDPIATIEAARADDPSRTNMRAVVAAWRSVIGYDKPMTAGEIKDWANSGANDPDAILGKALLGVAYSRRHNEEIDPLRLSHWLRHNRGRVVDGCKIVSNSDKHRKQMLWSLVSKGGQAMKTIRKPLRSYDRKSRSYERKSAPLAWLKRT